MTWSEEASACHTESLTSERFPLSCCSGQKMCVTAYSWVQVTPVESSAWQEFAWHHAPAHGEIAVSSCRKHVCSDTCPIMPATSASMDRRQSLQQGKACF